jgi:hypothetical protein
MSGSFIALEPHIKLSTLMSERFTEQTALYVYCRERLADQQQATRGIVSTVNVPTLTAPRPGGKWSIAAIFDHMAVMNRLYLQKLEPAIETAAPTGQRAWSPTLAGSLLRWAVNTRFKLPTAPLFKPADLDSDPEAIPRFLNNHERACRPSRALRRRALEIGADLLARL